MPKLTQAALDRCSNIAIAVDEELRKPFNDRQSIFIKTYNPRTMKGELAAYKTQYKQEWKTQFWMIVHDGTIRGCNDHPVYGRCLEFSFTERNRKLKNYEIVRPNETTVEIYKEDVGKITMSAFTQTPVTDLDETQVSMFILMESPTSVKLELNRCSAETHEWLKDQNQNPSPLIKMLQKQGYFVQVRGDFLWITREYDSTLD